MPHLDDDEAAEALARLGPAVLQKRGAAGALAVEAGGGARHILPAPPVAKVVDPTGAGDAVVGALAARLALGEPFAKAAEAALSAGALAVSGIGPAGLGLDLTPLQERRRA
jgi:sugar/nucleoside kinase (ribokinase family)